MDHRSILAHLYILSKGVGLTKALLAAAAISGLLTWLLLPLLFVEVPRINLGPVPFLWVPLAMIFIIGFAYCTRPSGVVEFSKQANVMLCLMRVCVPIVWLVAGWILVGHDWRPHLDPDYAKHYWMLGLPLSYCTVAFFTQYLPWSDRIHRAFEKTPPAGPAAKPID